jgi:hypothetical protein
MPVDQTQAAIQLAQNNADMVNFRCDWIKWATPELTRGRESDTTNWAELLHLAAFVSTASN